MNNDDIEWAQADLEHASTLKEKAQASAGTSFTESWASQGYQWTFDAWYSGSCWERQLAWLS